MSFYILSITEQKNHHFYLILLNICDFIINFKKEIKFFTDNKL